MRTTFYTVKHRLLLSLESLELLDHHGSYLEEVAYDAVVSNLKDGSCIVLVNSDDERSYRSDLPDGQRKASRNR